MVISLASFSDVPDQTISTSLAGLDVRVRLFPIDSIPYFARIAEQDSRINRNAVIVDLAQPRTDLKRINGTSMGVIEDGDFHMECESKPVAQEEEEEPVMDNKENMDVSMSNLSLDGNPLEVSFLTEEKLRKEIGTCNFVPSTIVDDLRWPLDFNPFTESQCTKVWNCLHLEFPKYLDRSLADCFVLLPTDGNTPKLNIMKGFKKASDSLCAIDLLGRGEVAMAKVKHLMNQFDLPMKVSVFADYKVLRSIDDDAIQGVDPGYFSLRTKWNLNQPISLLAHPPVTASVIATFSPGWMDSRVGYLERSEEIEFLLTLAEWLTNGKVEWPETSFNQTIINQVQELIKSTTMTNVDSNNVKQDFISSLWLILKEARSHITLQQCLQLTFNKIRAGQIKTLIGAHHNSSIARYLRSTDRESRSSFRFEELTSVENLLELGVDYLKTVICRDYLSHKLLPTNDEIMAYFVPITETIEKQAEGLLPLHLAMQSVMYLHSFINFISHDMMAFTRKAIKKFMYSSASNPSKEELTFEVPSGLNWTIFNNSTLSDWCLHQTFVGGNGKTFMEYYYYFSEQIECKHVSSRVFLTKEESDKNDTAKNEDEGVSDYFYGVAFGYREIQLCCKAASS